MISFLNKISIIKWKIITFFFLKKSFCFCGKGLFIKKPLYIGMPKYISIGDNCKFRDGLRLEVVDPQEDIVIRIGNNVNIEQNVHIVARGGITIGNNVSITAGCSIVDIIHPLQPPGSTLSYASVIEKERSDVTIGDGTMIGINSHISPGVKIGAGCVVGAHSVVMKDIPDYSICVGCPAKVIKKFDFKRNCWIRV
ncbi:acyltransferase [Shewanella algae]|uniref:acyltransferase n=1 Tax=Shewanella algae TaxID=38313 RepID=UPI0031F54207